MLLPFKCRAMCKNVMHFLNISLDSNESVNLMSVYDFSPLFIFLSWCADVAKYSSSNAEVVSLTLFEHSIYS